MKSDTTVRRRVFETPEGVPVAVELADLGSRATALLIDLAIIVCGILLAVLALRFLLAWVFGAAVGIALVMLASFFLRCPYFLFFELRWQGQTPGKRLLGLRVVDRRGAALSPAGLAARNLMREVEVFMPLSLLLTSAGEQTPMIASALVWMGVFTLMPAFNRDCLRVGDMLGGTWVIAARPVTLGQDLAASRAAAAAMPTYRFSRRQLDAYGIAELQVLERILRQPPTTQTSWRTRKEVCERICARTHWRGAAPDADAEAFLADYYAALRQHLERQALFGDRRPDKHALAGASIVGGASRGEAGAEASASVWGG